MCALVVAQQAFSNESSSASNDPMQVNSGKAVLKTQDLKTLLQANIAESAGSNEGGMNVGSTGSILMNLPKADVARLMAKIEDIAELRAQLATKLTATLAPKLEEIRKNRLQIQSKRLSSMSTEDGRLSKALYENILEESNIDSKVNKGLEEFDTTHVVTLDFLQIKGSRIVQSISLGNTRIWGSRATVNVAAAK